MATAPAARRTPSVVPPQVNAIVFSPALAAASMSNRVSPTVIAVVRHDAIQFLQRGGEDVRCRLGTVGFVGAGIAVDQLLDLEQFLDVILCVFFLTRTSEHDPFAVIANSPEEFAHLRERAYARKIFFSENFGAIFVEFFAETLDFIRRKKLGQILVGAFADLRA